MTVILVINSGSSSFKYQLIDVESELSLASGLVERIGEPIGAATHVTTDAEHALELPIPDHTAGFRVMLDAFAEHGPSLEEFTEQTPLTVGSPQQVIDKTLTFREHFGDYQRQLFLMDHAGLPLKTVLEQLELLGGEVIPVLRKEFDAARPVHVPDGPTHAGLVAASTGSPSTGAGVSPPAV